MSEECKLSIQRYRTPNGEPTCVENFPNKKMCPFYMFAQMGMRETCFWMKNNEFLERRFQSGIVDKETRTGFLIPFDGCPVWKE